MIDKRIAQFLKSMDIKTTVMGGYDKADTLANIKEIAMLYEDIITELAEKIKQQQVEIEQLTKAADGMKIAQFEIAKRTDRVRIDQLVSDKKHLERALVKEEEEVARLRMALEDKERELYCAHVGGQAEEIVRAHTKSDTSSTSLNNVFEDVEEGASNTHFQTASSGSSQSQKPADAPTNSGASQENRVTEPSLKEASEPVSMPYQNTPLISSDAAIQTPAAFPHPDNQNTMAKAAQLNTQSQSAPLSAGQLEQISALNGVDGLRSESVASTAQVSSVNNSEPMQGISGSLLDASQISSQGAVQGNSQGQTFVAPPFLSGSTAGIIDATVGLRSAHEEHLRVVNPYGGSLNVDPTGQSAGVPAIQQPPAIASYANSGTSASQGLTGQLPAIQQAAPYASEPFVAQGPTLQNPALSDAVSNQAMTPPVAQPVSQAQAFNEPLQNPLAGSYAVPQASSEGLSSERTHLEGIAKDKEKMLDELSGVRKRLELMKKRVSSSENQ